MRHIQYLRNGLKKTVIKVNIEATNAKNNNSIAI